MHMRMDEMPEVAQHMNMHTNEMAEVEPPKSKRQRVRSSQGRSGDVRRRDDD
jgi:hypothetical protein